MIERCHKGNLAHLRGELELSPRPQCNRLNSSNLLPASVCGYKAVTHLSGCSMKGKQHDMFIAVGSARKIYKAHSLPTGTFSSKQREDRDPIKPRLGRL